MIMSRIFPIIPASSKVFWFLGAIALLLFVIIGLLGYIGYSSRYSQFELSSEGLRIQGDLYGRTIPLSSLVVDEAKSINLIAIENISQNYELTVLPYQDIVPVGLS